MKFPAKMRFMPALLAPMVSLIPLPAWAAHAHVHGQARLDVAVDGRALILHLDSPLESLLGFEHPPYDKTQVRQAQEMVAKLRNAAALFVTPRAAACRLERMEIEAEALAPALLAGGTQAPAKPPRGGEQGEGAEHDDLDADFTFRCGDASALTGLEVKLFQSFPRLRQVDVQIAGPRGQSAARLNPRQTGLSW